MRAVSSRLLPLLTAAALAAAMFLSAQQAPENFRWVDFSAARDRDVVAWVTRSLDPEKWTAIREIGVEYDAALVETTERATPQSLPGADRFTVWYVSLTSHVVAPLLSGVNLRLLDWLDLADGRPRELAALYDDCSECAATTFITAFYYDLPHHMWTSRWMRGSQAAPVWSANSPPGVVATQVYAILSEPNGRQLVGTWSHFDEGKQKDAEDAVFRYDLDPSSGLERTQLLIGKEADAMKLRLCGAGNDFPGSGTVSGIGPSRGQDSALCRETPKMSAGRRPVTTPPANNHGQSTPPGIRH